MNSLKVNSNLIIYSLVPVPSIFCHASEIFASSILPVLDPDDLRLTVNNRSVSGLTEGQVEVFYKGIWRGICDDGWDLNDAKVVCRQLGFPDAVDATSGTLVGNGSSLTQLTNVQCNGSEEHLRGECPFSEMEADQNCSHGEAGVICHGTLIPADI